MDYIKNYNIVVSFNSKYLKMAETMLYSLLKNNGMNLHIYLLYSDLKKKEIEEVKKIIKKHKKHAKLFPIFIDKNKYEKFFTTAQFPIEACYRLIIQDILPKEEKRALWLDSDLVINKSIYDLYVQHFNDNYAVACDDISMTSDEASENLERLGLDKTGMYFNSGVILFNLEKIRKDFTVEDYFEFMNKNKDILKYPDQDTINYIYNGKIKHSFSLEYNLYVLPQYKIGKKDEKKIKQYTAVYHYIGSENKPETYKFNNFAFKIYWKYGKHIYGYKKYIYMKRNYKKFRSRNKI